MRIYFMLSYYCLSDALALSLVLMVSLSHRRRGGMRFESNLYNSRKTNGKISLAHCLYSCPCFLSMTWK